MDQTKAKDGKLNLCGTKAAGLQLAMVPQCSQKDFADQLERHGFGISKNAVPRIESGNRFVTDLALNILAQVFGVTTDGLISDIGKNRLWPVLFLPEDRSKIFVSTHENAKSRDPIPERAQHILTLKRSEPVLETGIHNTSEIGRLKKVLLHRPGAELENLMPEYLERLLFDDIPYLREAQREHDAFADCLRSQGVEVVYLTDLVTASLTGSEVRKDLIRQFLDESGVKDDRTRGALEDFLGAMPDREMVAAMMAGVRKSQLRAGSGRLGDYLTAAGDDYPFAVDPMPNLYFTRDPFATIGTGVSIHKMHTATRNRETLFGKFIFEHNPEYANAPRWYDRGETSSLEGGDILVLSPQVLAVGISQRTREDSIDTLAETVLSQSKTFQKVLAFNIPKTRSFMHLDTVFTMVDRDKFTVHPNILGEMTVFVMELDENRKMKIRQEDGRLEDILKEHLGLDRVTLIPCGQGSEIDAAREQWSDGSNTLAIGPGEVVVYSRNYVTNRSLEEAGIRIHTIPSAELSRGRGGPRCMSMPLWREDPNF